MGRKSLLASLLWLRFSPVGASHSPNIIDTLEEMYWSSRSRKNPATVYLCALRTKTVSPTELIKVISDTTVMPKAITHPVDAKLIRRCIERIVRAAKATGIQLKRTYHRVATWALKDYLRLIHGKKIRKAQNF